MLTHLEIKDFAIVDSLSIEFSHGLNVLTGETGAGKSILIDAIEFLVGGRANQTSIRHGAAKTSVQAVFSIGHLGIVCDLAQNGFVIDDGQLILSRELHATGRSISRVNGSIVPLGTVKTITELLIDLHGQHEHQTLLKGSSHIDWLDSLDASLQEYRTQMAKLVQKERQLQKELHELHKEGLEKELDFLKFQVNEINAANLKAGEDEELKTEKDHLLHIERLGRHADTVTQLLSNDERFGAMELLKDVLKHLEEMSSFEPELQKWRDRMEETAIELEELRQAIIRIKNNAEPDSDKLERVIERLDQIERLKRKYGNAISEILKEKNVILNKINELSSRDEQINAMNNELKTIALETAKLNQVLSDKRKKQSEILCNLVNKEMALLSIGLSFRIAISSLEKNTEKGKDLVEFQIKQTHGTNENHWMPLTKVASGGELSRLMLALKVVMAKQDQIPILIYDEIDTGLGGEAAFIVAEKLAQLAMTHQVLCVTHLHQIAAKAHNHCTVTKEILDGKIKIKIENLGEKARIREIARMMGGEQITDTTIQYAEELLTGRPTLQKVNKFLTF